VSSAEVSEVTDWLIENSYDLPGGATGILAEYVAQGHVFAAIKLTAGADVDEIHPLVFRYQGDEPCVPLKLTAVAAKADMAVRAFFLGDDRVFPSNYKHVELNPLRIDWVQQAGNYTNVVSRAVDEAVADGQAFVTEYAGASSGVNNTSIFSSNWNADAFRSLSGSQIVQQLNLQGVIACNAFSCNFTHPMALPLLREYLPAPEGQSEAGFYVCLANQGASPGTTGGMLDQECLVLADDLNFDAGAFADAYEERIVAPGRHADDILTQWPYLTRLFTTIDPEEMTVDPMFHARVEQTATVNQSRAATQVVLCDGGRYVNVADGRNVALENNAWPLFSSRMPYAERIEEVPEEGEIVVLVDNATVIDEQLRAWNDTTGLDIPGGVGTTGSVSTGGSSSTPTNSGGSGEGTGEAGANPSGGSSHPAIGGESDGCSCRVPGAERRLPTGLVPLLALVGVGLRRREGGRATSPP
jgi:MYXO-CTERM domain-containing protein